MKKFLFAFGLLFATCSAWAQQVPDFLMQEPAAMGAGWQGFTDVGFLVNAVLTLTLAAILGAILAYHPKHIQTADTMEEIEAPRVLITYAVIGALIGIMVVKYGLVIGFVLFGIGGLIRFRTVLRSPSLTGQVIFVTLIGLSCGLDLPHVAVLATVFGYVLIFVLNGRITYRIDIRALNSDRVAAAAAAYHSVLKQQGCRIMSEKKSIKRGRVTFIFRCSGKVARNHLEQTFESTINPELQGSLDWEID